MKIRTNPVFPQTPRELSVALGTYWRELATAINAQETVTLGNANGEIGGLTISLVYSQAEVQALRDKCEELADDVRSLKAALSNLGILT
jgi:hypothetical protein